mgnify:CR=1 FL=1
MDFDYIECGDCLELMKQIPNNSIDMILCDLPYGMTANSWDNVINFSELWRSYERIIKDEGAIVLFSQQPFTSELILSNLPLYKYNWTWNKGQGANFITSHYQPLRVTEDICVFSKNAASYVKSGETMIYNPQFTQGKPYKTRSGKQKQPSIVRSGIESTGGKVTVSNGRRYPTNLLSFPKDKDKLHPTQKPIALLEYLIKTYTSEGDIVLDNCMGSGSTCVAAINTNRHYIGYEISEEYFDIACNRLDMVEGEVAWTFSEVLYQQKIKSV